MLRLILFIVLVAVIGSGFAWFADRPGDVTLVWEGTRYQTSLMVVLAGLAALVASIMILWWIISVILRSPALMRRFYRNRRRDRGYYALSQGLIAASSGDAGKARKLAKDSRNLLGNEALVQLLDAQTLLLEGNRQTARERFTAMLDDDDTRLVGLRGLYLEAEREGEKEASLHYAEEAAKLSPSLPWAGSALLRYQSSTGDYEAALRTLETNRAAGLVGKAEAERKRAVLLTAQAIAEEPATPDKAIKHATQALKLAPSLVPAAVTAANAYARKSDFRRAGKALEAVWGKDPHPDIAQAYVSLRSGDSVLDRLKRARKLESLQPGHRESAFAVAEAAIAAKDWDAARDAMKPLIASGPTQRVCMIMADIEEGQHGDRGRMRDWLARAVRAPRDAAWTADGYVSDRWLPVSPVTGEIDAFEWKVPVARLGAPLEMDDLNDLAEPLPEPELEPEPEPQVQTPALVEETIAGPAGEAILADTVVAPMNSGANGEAPDKAPGEASAVANGQEMPHVPDDPGVEPEPASDKKAFRLF
jgi:HemY protein